MNFICPKLKILFAFFCTLFLQSTHTFGQNPYDIIITEIMADPTPSHGLPEKEYIELYNSTNQEISLKGIILEYQTSTVEFPEGSILPEEYLIVCRSNNVSFLEPYGKVIGLSKFSLLNGGAHLRLLNKEGEVIHQVAYSADWYTTGKDQGYALEIKDLNSACKEFGNWASSEAEVGGSPGKVNSIASVVNDTTGPLILQTNEKDDYTVHLIFDESISSGSVENIMLSSSIGIASIRFSDSLQNMLVIQFQESIPKNNIVSIEIDGVEDCLGNLADIQTFSVGSLPEPIKGQLILSEVLFDPYSGGADFVELYNASGGAINLKGLKLGRRNSIAEIVDIKEIATTSLNIQPNEVLCFTESPQAQLDNYPKANQEHIITVQDIPSYPNESGEVILLSKSGSVLDSLIYNANMHHAAIDNPDGVSLERIGLEDVNSSIWVSGSSADNYATPGYLNFSDSNSKDLNVSISPKIFTPDGDGVDDQVKIAISTPRPGNLTATIFDMNGKEVKILSNNAYINSVAEYYWDGTVGSKSTGNTGYYILILQHVVENELIQYKDVFVLGEK